MNSSTRSVFNIGIDCSIITLSAITILISTVVFSFILYHLIKSKNSPHRVALLLTLNVYFAILFFSIVYIQDFVHALIIHIESFPTFNDGIHCQIRAYFQFVFLAGIYYSNSLQAIYRLCRIVYHTNALLQSFKLYQVLIIIQWMICFLLALLISLLGYFQYFAEYDICTYNLTNFLQLCLIGGIGYTIPISITTGCYFFTVKRMRRDANSLAQRMTYFQLANARRDVIVLFRICLLLGLLTTSTFPAMISVNVYLFTHNLLWWSYQMQWLAFSLATTGASIVLVVVSPHVRKLWRRNRIRPHGAPPNRNVGRAN